MVNCLDEILKLQETDLRLRDLELRLKTLPQEMKKMLSRRDELQLEVRQAVELVRKIEAKIKQIEAEIERLQSENRKLQQQSALVKKNTEYQAMLNSVETNRQQIGKLEEQQILAIDKIEAAKSQAVKLKHKNDGEIKLVKEEFDELISFSKQIEAEIERLKKLRPSQLVGIPADILSNYERLLKGKNNNIPVCKVTDGICGGCHLRVTPQALNDISRSRMGICDNCQCFIYQEEQE